MANPRQSPLDPQRAWMRLPSGARLDLMNPDASSWTDEDLAIRLSRTYRWGGESRWPQPLSVAQHSLLVLELATQGGPLDAKRSLRELLHDAEEGFLGFDCISPLKRALGQPFTEVTDRLMNAVCARYALPVWTPEEHAAHKIADVQAAVCEAYHCVGWSEPEIRDVLGLELPVLDVDPLHRTYGGLPWEPWAAEVAAERFHARLLQLRTQEA